MSTAPFSHGLLFCLGIGVFFGLVGARLFQKLKIPQVVGYIVMGVIIGETGFRLVTLADIESLKPFNIFALGIIGFLVGGELKIEAFKKYGKQFAAILFGEGLGAFFLVGGVVTAFLYFLFHNVTAAIAAGVVFGAIASATDPASTIDVLWEYRTKGVLTTSIMAIVALDDALAMALYGIGTCVAQMISATDASFASQFYKTGSELLGSLIIGGMFALILYCILRWMFQAEKALGIALGLILIMINLAAELDMDVILAAMMLGFCVTNISPRRSEKLFSVMRGFSTPVYVLFFVLVGARLSLKNMPWWLWVIVGLYVTGRSIGKFVGSWAGAKVTKAPDVVRKYLGLGLFAQGGVAVGLSIMAGSHLSNVMLGGYPLGDVIIYGVTATTLMVQIVGPATVKLAVKLAGEINRNVTSEDVIASWTVRNVANTDVQPIPEQEPLKDAVRRFSEHRHFVYPIVDASNKLIGIMSLKGLKEVLSDHASWEWLLVSDVMEIPRELAHPGDELADIIKTMESLGLEEMPVVESGENRTPVGMITLSDVRRRIEEELLNRQYQHDDPEKVQGAVVA